MILYFMAAMPTVALVLYIINRFSYKVLGPRIASRQRWGLNICCGKTSYGEVNADIQNHCPNVSNYVHLNSIYDLPFEDQAFETTLCSHTIEHVENPQAFDRELRRVSRHVHYIVPPIWDLAAQLNFLEHKWIIVAWKKEHTRLPLLLPNPVGLLYQSTFRQVIRA